MKIAKVEPILLRGTQAYGAARGDEAVDNGDWQLLVRVATDEGLVGWADETLAPAAVTIIAGSGMSMLGFQTLGELLIGENPLDTERLWDKLYIGSAYYGRRGIAMHCISAINNCLWSIRAEAARVSAGHTAGRPSPRSRDRLRVNPVPRYPGGDGRGGA
jgi:L-rhamnonate dehydratase